MVRCPWCNEWEGPPSQYSDHLKYCKKYPPNIEAMKEQARVRPIGESEISERTQLINRLREAVSKLPAFHIEWSDVEQMSTSELREVVEDIEEQAHSSKRVELDVDTLNVEDIFGSDFEKTFQGPYQVNFTHKPTGVQLAILKKAGPHARVIPRKYRVWLLKGLSQMRIDVDSVEEAISRIQKVEIAKEFPEHSSNPEKIIRRLSPETVEWVREESKWRCPIASEEIDKYEREVRERKKLIKKAEEEWARERRVKIIELLVKHCPEALLEQ